MSDQYRWYVIHVHSGCERKVAQYLQEQAETRGVSDALADVLVPSEEVVAVRRGVKVRQDQKFFPGYVLVKMAMNDKVWHFVRNAPKVTGFLGMKDRPSPMSEAEAMRIIRQVEEGGALPGPGIHFDVGEQVTVCDGPFSSFQGVVEEVDEEKSRLKVSVSIFGRATPVDLEFTQVEKGIREE